MRCNSIGGRVTRLTPPCAKGVPVALAAPGSVAGAMDMDDGEGFPMPTGCYYGKTYQDEPDDQRGVAEMPTYREYFLVTESARAHSIPYFLKL